MAENEATELTVSQSLRKLADLVETYPSSHWSLYGIFTHPESIEEFADLASELAPLASDTASGPFLRARVGTQNAYLDATFPAHAPLSALDVLPSRVRELVAEVAARLTDTEPLAKRRFAWLERGPTEITEASA